MEVVMFAVVEVIRGIVEQVFVCDTKEKAVALFKRLCVENEILPDTDDYAQSDGYEVYILPTTKGV